MFDDFLTIKLKTSCTSVNFTNKSEHNRLMEELPGRLHSVEERLNMIKNTDTSVCLLSMVEEMVKEIRNSINVIPTFNHPSVNAVKRNMDRLEIVFDLVESGLKHIV